MRFYKGHSDKFTALIAQNLESRNYFNPVLVNRISACIATRMTTINKIYNFYIYSMSRLRIDSFTVFH